MVEVLSGRDLIDAGLAQGKWFGKALAEANAVLERGGSMDEAMNVARLRAAACARPARCRFSILSPEHPGRDARRGRQRRGGDEEHGRVAAHPGHPGWRDQATRAIQAARTRLHGGLSASSTLFASLQSRAFSGQL